MEGLTRVLALTVRRTLAECTSSRQDLRQAVCVTRPLHRLPGPSKSSADRAGLAVDAEGRRGVVGARVRRVEADVYRRSWRDGRIPGSGDSGGGDRRTGLGPG